MQLAVFPALLLACAWAVSTPSSIAQQFPPLPPTLAAPPPAWPVVRTVPPERHRAQVTYTSEVLTIHADNSSLSQILVQIASATGIRISGGAVDERVYGTYGPGPSASVLADLLDGSGNNMLLRENAHRKPTELILSPRNGGPTPPSRTNATQAQQDTEDGPPDFAPHVDAQAQTSNSDGEAIVEGAPAGINAAPEQPDASPERSTPTAAETTTQQSPNGVKTPQQIYDQLLQLQKQNAPTKPR